MSRRTLDEFTPTTLLDFAQPTERAAMEQALEKVRAQFGQRYDLVIGGERLQTGATFNSVCPADGEVLGSFAKADKTEAEKAVTAAWKAFESWSHVVPQERAELLLRAADIARERRRELAAWMIFEVGKSWVEADADVAEAIDFFEYYGLQMIELAKPARLTRIETEDNDEIYIPLGVGAIIPPWNFPVAIAAGMTAAAVVAGNTVVLKPSSDAAGCAHAVFSVLEEAGLPAGVVNLLTGPGAVAGETLVAHPRIRFVSFTGSKEVGLRINELAAKAQPGQRWIKRVIAEMGGKNAIVVDADADLDAAAQAVVSSAFGYQGQKCSACSRAIVDASVHAPFVEKVVALTAKLKLGLPTEPDTNMGPVINQAAESKIMTYIEIGRQEAKLVCGGSKPDSQGHFVQPTVFDGVEPSHRLAQEEVFGPVLAIIKSPNYDRSLEIANDTEYGLTGSVFTNDQEKIAKAKRVFFVGNLYINRKSTGALVGVHPFGGFNMSGTDSKAGGNDYLKLLTQSKLISEQIK